MTPSALIWFVDLTERYAATPDAARRLGRNIGCALKGKNPRIEVSRAFRHKAHKEDLPAICAWLDSDVRAAVAVEQCALVSALNESVRAFREIISGNPASTAWKMGNRRGADTGFSKTLDALAVVDYITKNPDLAYSHTSAVEVAATLFGIRSDTIRQHNTSVEFGDGGSAARFAYAALIKHGLLDVADHYFDTEELKEYQQPSL